MAIAIILHVIYGIKVEHTKDNNENKLENIDSYKKIVTLRLL
jgi:hypothetical protein